MEGIRLHLIAAGIAVVALPVNASGQVSAEAIGTRGEKTMDSRTTATCLTEATVASIPPESYSTSMEAVEALFKETDRSPLSGLPARDQYAVTVELARVSWPMSPRDPDDKFAGHVMLGLARPFYSLKKDIKISGKVDFNIESIVLGVRNQALLSLRYSLERSLASHESAVALGMERVTLKFGFPLWP